VFFAQNGVTSYPIPFPGSIKTVIKVDSLGNKWIGTHKKGLIKFDGANFTLFDTSNCAIPAMTINDLSFDSSSNLWMASKKGLSKFDGVNWITYNQSNSSLPSDSVYAICSDGAVIWAGTHYGLAKFDGTNWSIFNNLNSNIVDEKITTLNIDKTNGDIWIGGDHGITIKSGSNWIRYNSNNSNLNDFNISCILLEENTKSVLNGFDIFEFKNNSFVSISAKFSDIDTSFLSDYSPFFSAQTLSLGPQGGILTNKQNEIVYDQYHHYDLPSIIGGAWVHTYENTTNLAWFAGYYTLYSFDYGNYTSPSLVPRDSKLKQLDINEVKANLASNGYLHKPNYWGMGYTAPKSSMKNVITGSGIWVTGMDALNQSHTSAIAPNNWFNCDFQPGPLDTINGVIDSITLQNFDKIWKVDRLKIEEFQAMFANGSVQNGVYAVDPDILSWPAHGAGNYSRNLAPFVDVNADGIYNPLTDGDYPKIKGDQMCFLIFNDAKAHTASNGNPFNIEVHLSAYAYACNNYTTTDSLSAINYTTFYNYKIFNRSSHSYSNTKIGYFIDHHVGGGGDYSVGCNKNENYSFAYSLSGYNGGDGAGAIPYEYNPPIISTVILNGPKAETNDGIDNDNNGITDEANEKNLMTNFITLKSDQSVTGLPDSTIHFINYLNGKWKDGTDITYGGNGYGGSIAYPFMYDGIPGNFGWNETLPTYGQNSSILMNCGPFNLNSGENIEFDYAIVFTRDSIAPAVYSLNNLWQRNKQDVIKVKQWYAAANFPSCIESTDNSCYAQFTMAQDSLNNLNYYVYNSSSTGYQYSYLWNFGDGTTSTSAFPSHTYPGMGPYQLCLTVSDNSGCSSTTCDSLNAGRSSGVLTINVVPTTSIENNTLLNTATFNLFPNPSSNSITITTENFENNFTIHIYDITGRLVKSEKENAGKETAIDISSIESGIYFLSVTDGKQTTTKKFIKQ